MLFAALMILLVITPDISAEAGIDLLIWLIGIYVVVRGAMWTASGLARGDVPLRGVRISGGVTAMATGLLAIIATEIVTATVIAGTALGAIIVGLLLITWGLRRADGGITHVDPETASIPEVLWDWVRGSDIGATRREELADTLFHEQPERLQKAFAWWTMLVLSVAIATWAVMVDSTAVVIGAMLVAPLMAPILGLAGALVNGWRRRALNAGMTVILGTAVSIALSYGLAAWTPVVLNYDTNTQIVSRVTPTMIDMLIAVAAGAAGAFATVDKRVSSGIAGVAIAVALVPPLAVVGVSLSAGRGEDAAGALLLYLTNFVAIVLSAAAVFTATGFARHGALERNTTGILTTLVPFVALAAVVLLPLMFTSEGLLATATQQRDTQNVVDDWLGDDPHLVISDIEIASDAVTIDLVGSGDLPPLRELQEALFDLSGKRQDITVRVTPLEVSYLPALPERIDPEQTDTERTDTERTGTEGEGVDAGD